MQRISGFAEQGAGTVWTNSFASQNVVQENFPFSKITVYLTGTTTLAILYADNNTPPTPLPNPFTADEHGWWWFYVADGRYDIQITPQTAPSIPWTIGDVSVYDAGADPSGNLIAGPGILITQNPGPPASSTIEVNPNLQIRSLDLNNGACSVRFFVDSSCTLTISDGAGNPVAWLSTSNLYEHGPSYFNLGFNGVLQAGRIELDNGPCQMSIGFDAACHLQFTNAAGTPVAWLNQDGTFNAEGGLGTHGDVKAGGDVTATGDIKADGDVNIQGQYLINGQPIGVGSWAGDQQANGHSVLGVNCIQWSNPAGFMSICIDQDANLLVSNAQERMRVSATGIVQVSNGYLRVMGTAPDPMTGFGVEIWSDSPNGMSGMDVYDYEGATFRLLEIDASPLALNTRSGGEVIIGSPGMRITSAGDVVLAAPVTGQGAGSVLSFAGGLGFVHKSIYLTVDYDYLGGYAGDSLFITNTHSQGIKIESPLVEVPGVQYTPAYTYFYGAAPTFWLSSQGGTGPGGQFTIKTRGDVAHGYTFSTPNPSPPPAFFIDNLPLLTARTDDACPNRVGILNVNPQFELEVGGQTADQGVTPGNAKFNGDVYITGRLVVNGVQIAP